MSFTSMFYLGVRPVTELAGRDDPGESFARLVKPSLGLDVSLSEAPLRTA